MRSKFFLLSVCFLAGIAAKSFAEVRPASIFGDGMVLQREASVKVWGTADAGEKITVNFNGRNVKVKADKDGKWSVLLNPMPAGGPYTMSITGKENTVEYTDVLVGEVWLCGGQSNMEWTVGRTMNAEAEIAAADYPEIRCFTVTKAISPAPMDKFEGMWEVCSPETVADFTAVGYFFARELWRELDVPVGIVNSSWGGTGVETWTSEESYEALPANVRREYGEVAPFFRGMASEQTAEEKREQRKRYEAAFAADPAMAAKWYENPGDVSEWRTMDVPQGWSRTDLAFDDGHVWFRRAFTLPDSAEGQSGVISLGPIDDSDITWINGVEIGRTDKHDTPRVYDIPQGVLRAGDNTVAVRITDTGGDGGLYGVPADIWINAGGTKQPLTGEWAWRPSVITTDYGIIDGSPNMHNSLLFNAMINPMVGYAIKGVIWYQGEENSSDAYAYRTLFPNMIRDWRGKWGYEFPFYWAQLANYMAEAPVPSESAWAELREAQTMTLSLPKTGQAVIIDIGEADDIHPRNKQDVGRRLALNALAKDYGRTDMVYSGPTCRSSVRNDDKIVITFDTYGSELAVRREDGKIEGFAIAGPDRVFRWANAEIRDGKVVVWHDAIHQPMAVRYAWGDNPRVGLFNSEGLPAAPFRTDDWTGITVRK